jgi:hypothetical protein
MTKLSTDREILECIYSDHSEAFSNVQLGPDKDASKIYVPIDIPAIAERIDNNAHVLFGRLYYHLDHKYRYKQDNDAWVHLFAFKVGDSRHCINYPYLAAILSQHREQHSASRVTFWLAVAALALSLAAIVAQLTS